MDIPTKRAKNGFGMPVYGIGTWGMGGGMTRNPLNDDEADVEAIKTAIDLGIMHVDTAELYAAGHAEKLVREAIAGYPREKLFLVSKVKGQNLRYEDVLTAAENSLRRLGTDYLDLYLVHWPNPSIPLKETMKALDELLKKGLTKNIGVSNFAVQDLKEAQSYTKNKIVNNQVHYSLKVREPEENGVLEYCQKNDILLTAYTPLAKGELVKKEGLLGELAEKYDKTPAQVALNWLISQDNVVTIAKTRNTEHLRENLGAVGWEMKEVDIEKLRSEFPH